MTEPAVLTTVLHGVLMSAGSAALGGLLYLASQGAQWVAGRIKNERLREAWTLASDYAQRVVREVASSYVDPTKAAGKWNDATAAQAKTMATAQLRNMLVAQSEAKVLTLPATTGAASLDTLAATFVESAVHDLKTQGAAVAAQAAAAAVAAIPAVAPVVNVIQHGIKAAGTSAPGADVSRETMSTRSPEAPPPTPMPAPVVP